MPNLRSPLTALLAVSPWLAGTAADDLARPFLHPLFSDHAVLQQGRPIPVWGWTVPGAEVVVEITGGMAPVRVRGTADQDGRWQVPVGPFQVGEGPLSLTVAGSRSVTVSDLLVGEVWLMSGQSNMAFELKETDDAEAAIAQADRPTLRLYRIPSEWATKPLNAPTKRWENTHVVWSVSSPTTAKEFSAVGYYFGVELQRQMPGVPVGLISAAFGGASVEAFLPEDAVKAFGGNEQALAEGHRTWDLIDRGVYDRAKDLADWQRRVADVAGDPVAISAPGFDLAGWETLSVPGLWEDHGHPGVDGIAWYRTTVELPASAAGKAATLSLGPIDDQDRTYVNGTEVGATEGWDKPRSYPIPAGVLKAGANTLVIRVTDTGGGGGPHGAATAYTLTPDGGAALPLAGNWRFHIATTIDRLPPQPVDYGPSGWPAQVPTILYNRMIAPIAGYPLAGIGWYQGESNVGRDVQYRTLLPHLMTTWRGLWKQPKLPFLLVQLAGIGKRPEQPEADSYWCNLMLAQADIAHGDAHSGLACAYDLGDLAQTGEVHPKTKREVGRRLAYPALATVYGKAVVPGGPKLIAAERTGAEVRLRFANVAQGLRARGADLPGFALAGADGTLVWATARIVGTDTVVVSASTVPEPRRVQFAYGSNPVGSVDNSAGLPMEPFRRDLP